MIRQLLRALKGSQEDPGVVTAAGGGAHALSVLHWKIAFAVFLVLLVAPAAAVFISNWAGLVIVLLSFAAFYSAVRSPVYRHIRNLLREQKK